MSSKRNKYDFETIKEYLLQNHKNYKSVYDFIKRDPHGRSYYDMGSKRPELKKFISSLWVNLNKAYTLKDCQEKVKLCKTRYEFKRRFGGYYRRMIFMRWNDQVFRNVPKISQSKGYTYDQCQEKAKLCKSKYEMHNKFPGYYGRSQQKKWLKIFFPKNYIKKPPTFKECKEAAKKYTLRARFQENDITYYNRSIKKGWLDKICTHMVDGTQIRALTFEQCKEKALKCKTSTEFQRKHCGHYKRSRKKYWYKDISRHFVKIISNNEEKSTKYLVRICKKEATILYDQKVWYKYHSKPDLIISVNNKVLILELKDDRCYWSPKEIKIQKDRYHNMGVELFPNYYDTLIVSPKGKYGLSFKQLKELFDTLK